MELSENLLKRRSVRKFKNNIVEDEKIDYILHAATSGPSAMNSKPWEFYVIINPNVLKQLYFAGPYTKYSAPLAIVTCGNSLKMLSGDNAEFWIQDLSSATENILLAATDKGLGSVWCGIYPHQKFVKNIRDVLSLPDNLIPFNVIYIGYADEKLESRDQFDESVCHFIK